MGSAIRCFPLTVMQAGDKQMIGRRQISEQQMAMQRQQTLLQVAETVIRASEQLNRADKA
ncbi:hypothetical protein [Yersinia pseudotuberculosis]|nr:hypothetical protein [Yersinia pseudotuberculosis]